MQFSTTQPLELVVQESVRVADFVRVKAGVIDFRIAPSWPGQSLVGLLNGLEDERDPLRVGAQVTAKKTVGMELPRKLEVGLLDRPLVGTKLQSQLLVLGAR